MSLVTTKEMLIKAQNEGYAVGAFNVENMEMIQAVVAAAEKLRSPIIIQTTPTTVKYASPKLFFETAKVLAEGAYVPVAMHLDHGNSFELAVKAFHAGYTSIMIDGSKLPLDENILLTRSVVDVCKPCGVSVEGELGAVGGKEDEISADTIYTSPEEAACFVNQTSIDALAVAIGTAHGIYKTTPKLDLDRLDKIREMVDIPLVLHGTSGVDPILVKESIKRGICKVNYATDLRIAFSQGLKEYLKTDPDAFDPKKYNAFAREKVKACVEQRIMICGSAGKA